MPNLDIKRLNSIAADMRAVISHFKSVMSETKIMLRIAALLRSLTNLKPVLVNQTHFYGCSDMLNRFVRLCDDLLGLNRKKRRIYYYF